MLTSLLQEWKLGWCNFSNLSFRCQYFWVFSLRGTGWLFFVKDWEIVITHQYHGRKNRISELDRISAVDELRVRHKSLMLDQKNLMSSFSCSEVCRMFREFKSGTNDVLSICKAQTQSPEVQCSCREWFLPIPSRFFCFYYCTSFSMVDLF